MVTLVRDWMSHKPVVIRDDDAAIEAFDSMVDQGIRHLPVVDADDQLIGVVSLDDLRSALPVDVSWVRPLDPIERGQLAGIRVSDTMSWVPLTVRVDATLAHAAGLLSDHRIGCLPVVDSRNQLVGILTETDALRALHTLLQGGTTTSARRDVGSDSVVDELWAERDRLVEQLARWKDTERVLRDDAREPGDAVDHASGAGSITGLEPLSARAERRLQAIEVAIERAEHGRLGICERCQGRIPRSRLRVIPETALCVRCAHTTLDGALACRA